MRGVVFWREALFFFRHFSIHVESRPPQRIKHVYLAPNEFRSRFCLEKVFGAYVCAFAVALLNPLPPF